MQTIRDVCDQHMILEIITVHLDDFRALRLTFDSLQGVLSAQQARWIVVDGGSEAVSSDQQNLLHQMFE